MNIYDLLGFEEGYSKKPYYCSEGYPTIGKGTRIGPKGAPLEMYEIEFSEKVADAYLSEDVSDIAHKLNDKFDWFSGLTQARQMVLISMAYQLGYNGLLKFKKTIQAMKDRDYTEAKKQALDSLWASDEQTPERAMRHARLIGGEQLHVVYNDYL